MTKDRWQRLMAAWQISENAKTFDNLLAAYDEGHRKYHNSFHLDAVLTQLDKVESLLNKPHEVELALWFHDAIYQPFSKSNEKDSADWAVAFLTENKVSEKACQRVFDLVMVTQHNALPKSSDEEYLIDIDLTILGSQPKVFAQFEQDVRAEYKLVPYLIYRKKRGAILQGFLDRPRLYFSDFFYNAYEKQARENLKGLIDFLS